jgi:molybdopterin-guanine dinucleotide biosynthesis protein B
MPWGDVSMKVFGFAGWSGSGKTTLVEKLIPEFTARGLRVSVIKHAHHGEQLRLLEPCDLVLIEGYKAAAVPKIEIHRPSHGKPPLWPENPHVVAVATNAELDCPLPRLPLDEPAKVADFILEYLKNR